MGEGAGLDQAAAERRFRFELAAHPGSPAQARRLVRARLSGWSVCEDTCDTAALVISELVTNAIVHTASSVVVCELHDGDDVVRIAVRDEGCAPGEPHPSPQRPEEEHGRGLLLVEALCHAWGAQEHGPGLLVWADLPRQAEAPREETVRHSGLSGSDAEPTEPDASLVKPRTDLAAPSNDLGWGARPKPGPADDSGDEAEPAEQAHRPAQTPRPEQAHIPEQAHLPEQAHGPEQTPRPERAHRERRVRPDGQTHRPDQTHHDAPIRPDTTDTRRELTAVRPESTGVRTELTGTRPETTGARPEATRTRPDTTGIRSEVTGIRPEVTALHPDATGSAVRRPYLAPDGLVPRVSPQWHRAAPDHDGRTTARSTTVDGESSAWRAHPGTETTGPTGNRGRT